MFQKADDIKAVLTPVDLHRFRALDDAECVIALSTLDLPNCFKTSMSIDADKLGLAFAFAESNGIDVLIEHGINGFREKVPSAFNDSQLDLRIVYESGAQSFAREQIADAAYLFSVLASHSELRPFALLGLAACACHQGAYDTAIVFAQENIHSHDILPRTYLIAGYSALQNGNRKTAKRQLALAARLARGDARYRGEQRCAQRELLLMQLAS